MKCCRRVVMVVCVVFLLVGCKTTSPEAEDGGGVMVEQGTQGGLMPAQVLEAIEARVAAGEYPAMVVALRSGDESQVYSFGELGDGRSVDGDTLFEIASVTKTFTATLLADAVVRGRVKLDDSVAEVVPDLKLPVGPEGKAFTFGELASHYSGLPRLPDNMIAGMDSDNPYVSYKEADMKAFLADYEMKRSPGSSYEYSNFGYGLLGYVMGVIADSTYEAEIQARIFDPLGMTGSVVHRADANPEKLAAGHRPYGGGEVSGWDFDVMAGGGAIVSSANDMLRYLEANMQAQGVGADGPELLRAMQLAHQPLVEGPAAGQRTGLGWIEQSPGGNKILFHNGMTGGYSSFVAFSADGTRGAVVLTNVQVSVDDIGGALMGSEAPLRAARTTYAMSEEEIAELSGNYKLGEHGVLRVFHEGGQTYIKLDGQGALPVFASEKDALFVSLIDISVTFERDEYGQVQGLVLHQNGDHYAKRLSDEELAALRHRVEVKLSPEQLAEYVGSYEVDPKLAPNMVFEVTLVEGVLHVRLTGQDALPVYASALDAFFVRVVDAEFTFTRDEKGGVNGLVLHQGGQKIPAARQPGGSAGGVEQR